jgi:YHS domain-containing protein
MKGSSIIVSAFAGILATATWSRGTSAVSYERIAARVPHPQEICRLAEPPPKKDPAPAPPKKEDPPPKGPVNTKCPVKDEPIDTNITVDYKGKVIAFCCESCREEFNIDPTKFPVKETR